MDSSNDPLWRMLVFRVKNMAATVAPPFGLLRVTGQDEDGVFEVDLPDTDSQTDLLVNWYNAIPPGDIGQAFNTFPACVLYDSTGGTPAPGDTWGVEAGDWSLHAGQTGFAIAGTPANDLVAVLRPVGAPGPPGAAGTLDYEILFKDSATTWASYPFVISWDGVVGLSANTYWSSGNPSRVLIPATGDYEISCQWAIVAGSGMPAMRMYTVIKDSAGNNIIQGSHRWIQGTGTESESFHISPYVLHRTAGDWLTVSIYNSSGGVPASAGNIGTDHAPIGGGANIRGTWFDIKRVG